MTEREILEFFDSQIKTWKEARERVENLQKAQLKRLFKDDIELDVQHNPDRIVSTAAKTDKTSIAARPCFLCQENQPQEQGRLVIDGKYNLCVNPFPILEKHFTLSTIEHKPQELAPHITDMCRLALQWPSLLLFYNGAHSGASAPDHMHFQVAAKGMLPLQRDWENHEKKLKKLFSPHSEEDPRGIYVMEDSIIPVIIIKGNCENCGTKMFHKVMDVLPVNPGENEPRMNVVAWSEEGKIVLCIIPRTKHRPDCYFEEGDNHVCISPGCADVSGLIIAPIAKDFHALTFQRAYEILQEVTLTTEEVKGFLSNIPPSKCKHNNQ